MVKSKILCALIYAFCQSVLCMNNSDFFTKQLLSAVNSNNEKKFEELFQNNYFKIKQKNIYSMLSIAGKNGNKKIIHILLNKYPDLMLLKDFNIFNGKNSLHFAIENGYHDTLVLFDLGKNKKKLKSFVDDRGNTLIHLLFATKENFSSERIESFKYLKKYFNLGEINNDGENPLHIATRFNNEDGVKLLLQHGAFIMFKNKYGKNALHIAAECGSFEVLALFLKRKDIDINTKNEDFNTPIFMAIERGHLNIFNALLLNHARPTNINSEGDNIVHAGIDCRLFKILDFLSNNNDIKLLINERNLRGETPLFRVASMGKIDEVRALISNGARVTNLNVNGDNILHVAIRCRKFEIFKQLSMEKIKSLINQRNCCGFTPKTLLFNVLYEDSGILFYEIAFDVCIENKIDGVLNNFLIYGLKRNCPELVKKALLHGADANHRNFKHKSMLQLAVNSNMFESFKYLLFYGGDIWQQDEKGRNIAHMLGSHAGSKFDKYIKKLPCITGDKEYRHVKERLLTFLLALKVCQLKVPRRLLQMELLPAMNLFFPYAHLLSLYTQKDSEGKTPFQCYENHQEIIKYQEWLKTGHEITNSDFKSLEINYFDKLKFAIEFNYTPIVRYLLENVKLEDWQLISIFKIALKNHDKNYVDIIINCKQNPFPFEAEDSDGNTPLLLAIMMNRYGVTEFLLLHKAHVEHKNKSGLDGFGLAEKTKKSLRKRFYKLLSRFKPPKN